MVTTRYASKAERIANTTAARLLAIPGVNVIMPGTKKRNGLDTGQTCVTVGVTRKKPLSELRPQEILPGTVSGVATDVIESGPIRALAADTNKYRPVVGGISGHAKHPGATAGTIGGVVMDSRSGRLVALTNNHVAGLRYDSAYLTPTNGRVSVTGLGFMQPAEYDGGTYPDDVIGAVVRAESLRMGTDDDTPANLVDAAIVSLDDVGSGWYSVNSIHAGPFLFGSATPGQTVKKTGRTTGATTGTVTATNASINVYYGQDIESNRAKFTNQLRVEGTAVADEGDSGSLVLGVQDGVIYIVGLLFSGSSDAYYANHIADVADVLDIEAWDGSVVLARSLEFDVQVNSIGYRRYGDTTRAITHEVDE